MGIDGRPEKAGQEMANAIIELVHLMYQKTTAKKVITSLISVLVRRMDEFETKQIQCPLCGKPLGKNKRCSVCDHISFREHKITF